MHVLTLFDHKVETDVRQRPPIDWCGFAPDKNRDVPIRVGAGIAAGPGAVKHDAHDSTWQRLLGAASEFTDEGQIGGGHDGSIAHPAPGLDYRQMLLPLPGKPSSFHILSTFSTTA